MPGRGRDYAPVVPRRNVAAVDSDESQRCYQHRQPGDHYEPECALIACGHADRPPRRSDCGRTLHPRAHRRIINPSFQTSWSGHNCYSGGCRTSKRFRFVWSEFDNIGGPHARFLKNHSVAAQPIFVRCRPSDLMDLHEENAPPTSS
jgi:hypothetical protein